MQALMRDLTKAGVHAVPSYNPFTARIAIGLSPNLALVRRHVAVRAAESFEFVGDISEKEAQKFEKIAASLVARLPSVPAGGEEDDEALDEDEDEGEEDGMLPFGASPEQVEAVQKRKAEKEKARRARANSGGEASSSNGVGFAVTGAARRARQIPNDLLPKVAIVGRPNVGKSALFNRIAGASVAVVFDEPGVTRDRLYTRAMWGGKDFVLIDTGGLMSDATALPADVRASVMRSISAAGLPQAIERQAAAGVAEADVIILLVDGKVGVQPGDREILDWLRQNHPDKALVLGVNKCDNVARSDMAAAEFWELGLQPHPLSAITGSGTGEMLDELSKVLPPPKGPSQDAGDTPLAVAIVGRPNVGKSSLLNAICGEDRVIVCDMSGTTRDAVDTEFTLPSGQRMKLIDTAGIRKRTKVAESKDGAEQISVDRALRAIRRAEVVVSVVDASEGITQQDFRLTEMAAAEGRAVVVVVNKWDKVDQRVITEEMMKDDVRAQLRHVSWASVVCTSAHKGKAVPDVVAAIVEAGEQHKRRVSTATLNMVLQEATAWKAPPTQRKSLKKGRIYYATQAGIRPPTFVFFVNDTSLISDDYRRYMDRALRDNIGLVGSPMRLLWRGKPETDRTVVRVKPQTEGKGSQGSRRQPPPSSKPHPGRRGA